jgi:hypothetical protein
MAQLGTINGVLASINTPLPPLQATDQKTAAAS